MKKTRRLKLGFALATLAVLAGCSSSKDSSDDPDNSAATVSGRVTDAADGTGIAGVTISAGGLTATTDTNGAYSLAGVPPAAAVVVSFTKSGFVPQSRTTDSLATDGATVLVNLPMLKIAFSDTYDPTIARNVAVPGSTARVALAANTLRTGSGGMPSGLVTARVTPIAAAGNLAVMPGNFNAAASGSTTSPIESFGALDVSFVDASGAALNLASGQSSTIRLPVSTRATGTPPATMPLFFFNATSGLWVQEGTAALQGTAPNQYYEGTVSHFTTWNADQVYNTVTITGCVQDATGARVAGASVTSEGKTYTGMASTLTDAGGNFTVAAKSNSELFLQATKGTQISNAAQQQVFGSTTLLQACLSLTQATLSIKLTWGAAPRDLDSHTYGANSDEEIAYYDSGSLTAAPYIALDVDDVSGFGPEVTTFSRLAKSRTYRFYVDNYSESYNPGQTGSPARVEVLNQGVQTVFTPPTGESDQTPVWHVFDVTVNSNCVATIVPIQQFKATPPGNPNVGNNASYCN